MLKIISNYNELDGSRLMRIYSEGNRENTDELYPEDTDRSNALRKVEEDFLDMLEKDFFPRPGSRYLVWEENGEWVSALRLYDIGERLFFIEALETVPESRRRGFGARLLSGTVDMLKAGGPFTLRDCVGKRNLPSLRTHEKCGFRIVSDIGHSYIGYGDNEYTFGLEYRYAPGGITVGLAHFEFKNGDTDFNINSIERGLKEASGRTDLLVFGEAFLQGFDCLSFDYERDKHIAVSRDSETIKSVCALSKKYGVDLIFGYIERDGEALYSSCALIEGGRLTYNYRRISMGWKEIGIADGHYREGDAPAAFTYRGREMMLALCGDMWDYPERFRTGGVLIWPVFVSFSAEEWKEMEIEYADQALKAAKIALMVNSVCREEDCLSLGGAFEFEDGRLVSKAPYEAEGVLYVDIH